MLNKPYHQLEPETDFAQVRAYLAQRFTQPSTRASYQRGLSKLAQYVRQRNHLPEPPASLNWPRYVGTFPDWLTETVRAYLDHRRRAWPSDNARRLSLALLSHLTGYLRWLTSQMVITDLSQLTPACWFDYVDERLAQGIRPTTLNRELYDLQDFLTFAQEQGQTICVRMRRVEPLDNPDRLPRDVPLDQLRRLLQEVEAETTAPQRQRQYTGRLDQAWLNLMLYSGLRTGEVRRLRLSDLNLAEKRVRIEQSKGLKDRVVYLSPTTVMALTAYLACRSPADSDHLFIYRHRPLQVGYCGTRLITYGQRCGVLVTPHQLRHSCATLLLNAGTPILTVQKILGHKHIDTTLGYARLYEGTIAADYYRAMNEIERRITENQTTDLPPPTSGQLLALVDALSVGTLNEAQRTTVQSLRAGLVVLADTLEG